VSAFGALGKGLSSFVARSFSAFGQAPVAVSEAPAASDENESVVVPVSAPPNGSPKGSPKGSPRDQARSLKALDKRAAERTTKGSPPLRALPACLAAVPAPAAAVLGLAALVSLLAMLLAAAHASGAVKLPPALLESPAAVAWPRAAWAHSAATALAASQVRRQRCVSGRNLILLSP